MLKIFTLNFIITKHLDSRQRVRGNAVVLDSVGARPDTSELLYPAYSATPDIVITKTELFCRVWCGDVK